jgi:hypothetical protein
MQFTIGLEVLNVLLLVFLLYVYVQNYRQMKTVFGLGLIVFALFLLLQNGMASYFHLTMANYYSMEAKMHATLFSGAQTVALIVLAWVTWKQ